MKVIFNPVCKLSCNCGDICLNAMAKRKYPFKKLYVLIKDRYFNGILAEVFRILTNF